MTGGGAKPRVSVVIGPGHHGDAMVGALRGRGMLSRVVRPWPSFRAERGDGSTIAEAPWFDLAQRAVWAAWRRLPVARAYETPRALFSRAYGQLARRYIDGCDVLVGWLQVSLDALRDGRRQGAATLLEHPMNHIDAWGTLLSAEYERWGEKRGGYFSLMPADLVRRMKREYDEAMHISVLSSFSRRTFVEAGVPAEKLVELPLGIDASRFRPSERPAPEGGPLRVLYVGRLELLKGVPYLLEAFAGMKRRDVELTLVGPSFPEMNPVLARFANARVKLVGNVAPADLPPHYREADVLVFPSVNDAFGLVLLEAMASGLPVVTTDHTAGTDVVREGIDGFVVPARDAGAIRDRLERFADDRAMTRRMGEAARARVLEQFTHDHYAARVAALCERLAQRGPGRDHQESR